MSEARVRQAFAQQAAVCAASGAPFTGRVCGLIGERLDRTTALGRRILDWPGPPAHDGDALPLRLAGGLHALARTGSDLASAYPPNTPPSDDDVLWRVIDSALISREDFLAPWLDGPPQTNEVGRSAALMTGLLVLADRFGLPFSLFELGASAGLNTVLDRYAFDLGGVTAGDPASPVRIAPEWSGPPPPTAKVRIAQRAGCDRNPLDPTDPATRERLMAYVWTDQRDRLERLGAALDIAAADPAVIERADAADWLEDRLSVAPQAGVCRVVMHTIAFQYFPSDAQDRIRRRLAAAGEQATADAPLAWLRFEADQGGFAREPVLRLTVWPGGEDTALAVGHPHVRWLRWLA